jgi:hypothetical protein
MKVMLSLGVELKERTAPLTPTSVEKQASTNGASPKSKKPHRKTTNKNKASQNDATDSSPSNNTSKPLDDFDEITPQQQKENQEDSNVLGC